MTQGMDDINIANVWEKITPRLQQLAGFLKISGDNRLGTLPFKGIIHEPDSHRHAFVFDFPDLARSYEPITLRDIIGGSQAIPFCSLESRFTLAERLSASISCLHEDEWIHKNIQSQSIVFLKQKDSKRLYLEDPYLVNFEYSRPVTASTLLLVDSDEEKSVYRHPDIQYTTRPTFNKMHDIYALGVVLLEIALWQPAQKLREGFKKQDSGLSADGLRECLIRRAKQRVPSTMGTSYQAAIEWCLTSDSRNQMNDKRFSETFFEEVTAKVSASAVA